jgi:TctA family transporter
MSAGAHIFHFILTLITGGFWLPLWIICALCSGSSHKKSMKQLQIENNQLLRKLTEKDGKK